MRAVEVRGDVLLLGVLNGLSFGLVAIGLVLAFRASRVLNLAHGQVGAFGAAVLGLLVIRWDVPYWTALPVALAAGVLVGCVLELTVVRRLRHVPPLMTLVATLGVGQLLQLAAGAVGGREVTAALFPEPAGLPSVRAGALLLTPAYLAMLVLAPATVAGLVHLLRATDFGLALRASADNPDAARALGVPARRYATAAWGLAGGLATLTAVLVLPAGGAPTLEALGPSLLLRALAAAVIAGMSSLPGALGAGVAIGALDQVVRFNSFDPGVVDAVLLAVIAVALLHRRPPGLRRVDARAWSVFEGWERLPAAAREVPLVRWSAPALGALALAVALALPLVVAPGEVLTLTVVACSALVGVSVWILTGLAGQLSFGQFALAGVGCAAAAVVERRSGNAGLGLVGAAAVAGALAVVVGLIAARAGGFSLAVLTLALGLAVPAWLLPRDWALGDGVQLRPLVLGPLDTSTAEGSYAICVLALAIAVLWARALGRSPYGRRLRAVRDNAPVARALGVDATAHHVQAIALAGALAGVAGALFGHALTLVSAEAFPASRSVDVVAMAVVGGLSVAVGPVLGALWIIGLPDLVDLSSTGLAASAVGWLLLLLYLPSGLAGALEPVRRAAVRLLLRVAGHDPALAAPPVAAATGERRSDAAGIARAARDTPPPRASRSREPVLSLSEVRRRFGTVEALAGVSLDVHDGEIVAVIGPNGAGKTTLLDVAGGLERPDGGEVVLRGERVTGLPPHRVAARGLGRSFQDVELFPTLTVRELVLLGAERRGLRTAGRRTDELLASMGLEGYAGMRVRALSTGTRRMAELACLLAAEPRVLLLDEPTAGLAQPEAEALAALLRRLRDHTGVALLVVEHDLSVVAALADRVVVLLAGTVVAEGDPRRLLAGGEHLYAGAAAR